MTLALDLWTLCATGILELRWTDGDELPVRETRQPGADVADLTAEAQAACVAMWTPAFVTSWKAEFDPPPGPPAVPFAVTARQARLALLAAGLLATVEAAIGGLPEAERIEWEYAAEIRRDHPLIASLAVVLGLSPGEVDDLFRAAEGL